VTTPVPSLSSGPALGRSPAATAAASGAHVALEELARQPVQRLDAVRLQLVFGTTATTGSNFEDASAIASTSAMGTCKTTCGAARAAPGPPGIGTCRFDGSCLLPAGIRGLYQKPEQITTFNPSDI
jgi:hypothetical protein